MIKLANRVPVNHQLAVYCTNIFSNEQLQFLLSEDNWQGLRMGHVGELDNYDPNVRAVLGTEVAFDKLDFMYWENLEVALNEANSQFLHVDIDSIVETLQLMKYTEEIKGHYDWHIDTNLARHGIVRKLTMITMLSDPKKDFEGGELLVRLGNQELTLEQEQNKAWIFPSWLPHKVTPVTKGTRKVAVVWVSGPEWR